MGATMGAMTEWKIVDGPTVIPPDADVHLFEWAVSDGAVERTVLVAISGTLMATDPARLDPAVAQLVATRGRPEVLLALEAGITPRRITINTNGVWRDDAS